MDFYTILVHLHSILRWILLISLLSAIFIAFSKKPTGLLAGPNGLRPALWALITAHIQLILGLVLYFTSSKVVFDATSMKNPVLRFFLVEHLLVMLIAIVLITIGYVKAKKAGDLSKRHRNILVYYIIALILILSRIPWPFLDYGGGWL